MSRFYATAVNSLGNTVAIGGRGKGAGEVHLRGWNAGVKVVPGGPKGTDTFDVYMTTGSHASGKDKLIGHVVDTPDGPVFRPVPESKENVS